MKKIVCTSKTVKMQVNTNILGGAEILLIKTTETWRGGGLGSKVWIYNINWKGL